MSNYDSSYICMSARMSKLSGQLVELNPRKIKEEELPAVNEAKQEEFDKFVKRGVYTRVPLHDVDRRTCTVLPT